MVGIAPLFAVCILKRDTVKGLNDFERRTDWFLQNKKQLSEYVEYGRKVAEPGDRQARNGSPSRHMTAFSAILKARS